MNPPLLMGILNVTPDSFSDGGLHFTREDALERARIMAAEGADWIDVGGESTRPGAEPVSVDEELRRVIPVIEVLAGEGLRVSIDTMKPEVARIALAAGAQLVNDVNSLKAEGMKELCAEAGCQVCLMHMQGEPRTMQSNPAYGDVVEDVKRELLDQVAECESAGIKKEKIWIDPGIGFGKNLAHNLTLLKHVDRFVETGLNVLVGVSRKSFVGRIAGSNDSPAPVERRLEGTLAAQQWCAERGVQMLRVHDVAEARRSLQMLSAILNA